MIKTHKRKKSSRMLGRGTGSNGWGFRKCHRKKGHKGGKGMSGTGKRGDQKKTLVNKLYGNDYFGKKGITSRKNEKDRRDRISLATIENNLESFGKKEGDKWTVSLENYKILGKGKIKNKLVIKAKEASKSAIESVKKAGGEIVLPKGE